jgi:hypothetical protein
MHRNLDKRLEPKKQAPKSIYRCLCCMYSTDGASWPPGLASVLPPMSQRTASTGEHAIALCRPIGTWCCIEDAPLVLRGPAGLAAVARMMGSGLVNQSRRVSSYIAPMHPVQNLLCTSILAVGPTGNTTKEIEPFLPTSCPFSVCFLVKFTPIQVYRKGNHGYTYPHAKS